MAAHKQPFYTIEQRAEMIKMRENGMTYKEIAIAFGGKHGSVIRRCLLNAGKRALGRPAKRCACGDYGFVELTKGMVAIIDADDVGRVSQASSHWSANQMKNTTYAESKNLSMHRVVMNAPKNMDVDHINGCGLDNRKENLRICTRQQNIRASRNRIKSNSGYRGVQKNRNCKTYVAHIYIDGKRLHIGSFRSAVEAAVARDKAAKEFYGEFAALNFPDGGENG